MAVTDKSFNPSGNELVDEIKTKVIELEELLMQLPAGRRRSISLTHLEDFSMWAVKTAICGDN